MLIGWLMLLAPIIVFLVSLPFSRWFMPRLRIIYRIAGGMVVFLGSGVSLYFALYGGDQGGIAAYFFQMGVIVFYTGFSIIWVGLNWLLRLKRTRNRQQ